MGDAFAPKKEDRFSFGLWTVGNVGRSVLLRSQDWWKRKKRPDVFPPSKKRRPPPIFPVPGPSTASQHAARCSDCELTRGIDAW